MVWCPELSVISWIGSLHPMGSRKAYHFSSWLEPIWVRVCLQICVVYSCWNSLPNQPLIWHTHYGYSCSCFTCLYRLSSTFLGAFQGSSCWTNEGTWILLFCLLGSFHRNFSGSCEFCEFKDSLDNLQGEFLIRSQKGSYSCLNRSRAVFLP